MMRPTCWTIRPWLLRLKVSVPPLPLVIDLTLVHMLLSLLRSPGVPVATQRVYSEAKYLVELLALCRHLMTILSTSTSLPMSTWTLRPAPAVNHPPDHCAKVVPSPSVMAVF